MSLISMPDLDAITEQYRDKKSCLTDRLALVEIKDNSFIKVRMLRIKVDGAIFTSKTKMYEKKLNSYIFNLESFKMGSKRFIISNVKIIRRWYNGDYYNYEISFENNITMDDYLFIMHFVDHKNELNKAFIKKEKKQI